MARRRWRLWFRLTIRGVQWSVGFGNLGPTEQGECDYDRCRITISWGLAREAIYQTLHHELGHANADASGWDKLLHSHLKESTNAIELDELLMRTFNQAMFETLAAAGALRYPPIPEWFDAK